jgi:hypothetical protein
MNEYLAWLFVAAVCLGGAVLMWGMAFDREDAPNPDVERLLNSIEKESP